MQQVHSTLAAILLAACLLAACLVVPGATASAEPARPVRIASLNPSWGPSPGDVGLRDGLLELGYREDVDFEIGVRFTQGDLAALPAAARKLVGYGVDIIFAVGISAARAAQQATTSIPVIFVSVDDPVQAGLIQSFARPGGNITGVADGNTVLAPKRLEVFKEILPRLKKVLFVYDGGDHGSIAQAIAYRGAGSRLGIAVMERTVRTEAEAQAVFAEVRKGDVDGILAPVVPLLNIIGMVVETGSRKGIPTMFPGAFLLEQGGLASYAPAYYASGREAARLVDKIMRGVKSAEIPVEVNNHIEFIINLKVAKALGLTIAPEVLYQADRLIR